LKNSTHNFSPNDYREYPFAGVAAGAMCVVFSGGGIDENTRKLTAENDNGKVEH